MWAPTPDALLLTSWSLALGSALAGGIHCAVMCGPLRLIVEKGVAYQTGRFIGYLSVGAFFGALGWKFPWWVWVPIYILLVSASLFQFKWWKRVHQLVLKIASAHPFLLGTATAFFPCGLLYAWVGIAALAKDPIHGAFFLGILWAGSLPSLELASVLQKKVWPWRRRYPKAFTLILLLLVSVPLLLRANSLHTSENAEQHSCH